MKRAKFGVASQRVSGVPSVAGSTMPSAPKPGWTFFSNHGHVLFYLAAHPSALLREVSIAVCITERAVQRIVTELVDHGALVRERNGRGNVYTVMHNSKLRHPIEAPCTLGKLVTVINGSSPAKKSSAKKKPKKKSSVKKTSVKKTALRTRR